MFIAYSGSNLNRKCRRAEKDEVTVTVQQGAVDVCWQVHGELYGSQLPLGTKQGSRVLADGQEVLFVLSDGGGL